MFENVFKMIDENFIKEEFIYVYKNPNRNEYIYLGLIDNNNIEHEFNNEYFNNNPLINKPFIDNENNYHTLQDYSIESIVLIRYKKNIPYYEISQDFILFFDLHKKEIKEDNKTTYICYDKDFDEETVIIIYNDKKEIKIKYSFIIYYSSIRKKNLILLFDFFEEIDKKIKEVKYKNNELIYNINSLKKHNNKYSIQLIGKKIINRSICNLEELKNPTDYEIKYEYFLTGYKNGEKEYHSCNCKNNGNLKYKKVFFKKEVLKKYYDNTEKYSVEDGEIKQYGIFYLSIDNNCKNHISAYLGDLSALSYKEQKYWKSYNFIPEEKNISYTSYKRDLCGEWAEPESPDLKFKKNFIIFNENFYQQFGWYLFKPLNEDDQHYFDSLSRLVIGNQKEFEEKILAISKIIIESINSENIEKIIINDNNYNSKLGSIKKLKLFLEIKNIPYNDKIIEFIENLQLLRNSVVHRKKSKENQKSNDSNKKMFEYFKYDEYKLTEIIDEILFRLNDIITIFDKNINLFE